MLPRRWHRKLAALVPLGTLAVVLASVSIPAYIVGPGPARDVEPRIEVDGPTTYRSEGRFVLTSVLVERTTVLGAVGAWLDPATDVVPEEAILGPGETEEEGARRAVSQMDQSKIDAVSVVLTELTGYPEEHGDGVLVESVVSGCPAAGRLFPGDVIRRVDGTTVRDLEHLDSILGSVPGGGEISLVVEADGETEEVSLVPAPCADSHDPLVGIVPIATFPFPVSISSGDIGGPSAGLMWALGLYDLLTPGDLTGGRTIAGTGAIDLLGRIHPIGGIGQKVLAAEQAGAAVFLVPEANLAAAREVAGELELIPVATVQDALDYLTEEA